MGVCGGKRCVGVSIYVKVKREREREEKNSCSFFFPFYPHLEIIIMFWMEFQDFGNHTFTELFDAKKFLFFPFFLLFFLSPRGGSPGLEVQALVSLFWRKLINLNDSLCAINCNGGSTYY